MAPRYFNEKKIHFCVMNEEEKKDRSSISPSRVSANTDGENCIYYTYVSSCATTPANLKSKKTFA